MGRRTTHRDIHRNNCDRCDGQPFAKGPDAAGNDYRDKQSVKLRGTVASQKAGMEEAEKTVRKID